MGLPMRATGWRGAAGASSIPMGKHGSGGMYGVNLSPPLSTINQETGVENISNTATLPNRNTQMIPDGVPNVPRRGGFLSNFGVPGRHAGFAYGNPAVVTEEDRPAGGPWQAHDKPAPGYGNVGGDIGVAGPGGEAAVAQVQPFPMVKALGVGQESAWRGGLFFANDRLEVVDRHGILDVGHERGGGRNSGLTDPPMDGPARPNLRLVQRKINWQVGNPLAHQDQEPGENRYYHMVNGLKQWSVSARVGGSYANKNVVTEPGPQFVGEQGTGWSPVYGGVPGLWQPYGSYAGYTAGPVHGIQSPAAEGSEADGPQLVFSGLPHGLHSQTYPDYSSTLGRYLAIPQMTPPRQDRPANSPISGQSFNQLVVPQGEIGTQGVQAGSAWTFSPTPAQSAMPSQAATSSWRGQQDSWWRGIRPGGQQT